MKAKYLFGIAAMVVSFVVVGMCLAADPCTHLNVACPGWGATNPPVQGYCCIGDYSATKACGTGVKSVTVSSSTYCGHLKGIVNGQCTGNDLSTGCGAYAGVVGCISGNCSGS